MKNMLAKIQRILYFRNFLNLKPQTPVLFKLKGKGSNNQ